MSVFHAPETGDFAEWAATLAASATDSDGCLGVAISAVTDGHFDPAVATTFVDEDALDRWLDSSGHRAALDAGRAHGWLPATPVLELVDGRSPPPGVGAFRHDIVAGAVGDFVAAQHVLVQAASEFGGYEGTALFVDEQRETSLSVLRFRTDRQLAAWVSSSRRSEALAGLRSSLTHDFETMASTTAFGTTVRTDRGRILKTPNWKSAMIVLLVLYPTVMTPVAVSRPYARSARRAAMARVVAQPGRQRHPDAVVADAVGITPVPAMARPGRGEQLAQQCRGGGSSSARLPAVPDRVRQRDVAAVVGLRRRMTSAPLPGSPDDPVDIQPVALRPDEPAALMQ